MTNALPQSVKFSELVRWDVKYFWGQIKSKYPLVSLATFVRDHNEKIRPFEYPEDTFKILGVNNTHGIFHAYDALGKDIKQPYKKVSADDFAYNPYRINVGSIGRVSPEHDGAFISPAYVVFSIDKKVILPELFWFILKSEFFNQTLRAATAGSVRMNLTYPLLETLKIPVPPISVQESIITYLERSNEQLNKVSENSTLVVGAAEEKFLSSLGLKAKKQTKLPKLMCQSFRTIGRWSILYNQLSTINTDIGAGKYPIVPFQKCLEGTTNGYSIRPVKQKTNYKILKLSALKTRGLDLAETKYVKVTNQIIERFKISKDDLLICRSVGSFDHIAKCALAKKDYPNVIFPDIIIRARFNESILPEYAMEVIQSSIGKAWFQQKARTAVGMWKIGGADIKKFPMPLPSLAIQKNLVDFL